MIFPVYGHKHPMVNYNYDLQIIHAKNSTLGVNINRIMRKLW